MNMKAEATLEQSPISLDWSVAQLLSCWPQATRIFIKYRMNCVGCSMAAFERLGDALAIYGVSANSFLDEFHMVIQDEE
jgi:hybrid cluster-associated redox disulfide protein